MVSEATCKVPETLEHFWENIWLLKSGLIVLNEWFASLLKKETQMQRLAAIGRKKWLCPTHLPKKISRASALAPQAGNMGKDF